MSTWAKQLADITDTPRLEAEILFKHISHYNDIDLIRNHDQIITAEIISKVDTLIHTRLSGKPIAYIIEHREFYGLDFKVNEHVLIPRPETELLVDIALAHIQTHSVRTILDLGTGSGAIACTLAHHTQSAHITALDKSLAALELAKENAENLKLNNIEFHHSDWFEQVDNKHFDLIISNPPYVAENDIHLSQGDVRFEPDEALVALDHGMADIQHIVAHATEHLNQAGALMIEHGYNQGAATRTLFKQHAFHSIQTIQDLNHLDRLTLAYR
ncbi:MAG: peptide chain release factor N(5)-glutamine methyltransferase [Arenicellales bacterium]